MTERIVAPRLADIIEAIERIRRVLDGVTLEAFEQNWEKRWLVERGIEIISEASRHLTDDIKERRPEIPWPKVAGIGNVLRHAYDHVAPDVLWKLAQDDLAEIEKVCREELVVAEEREHAIRPGWREGSGGAVGPGSSPGPSGPAGLTICKQIRHLPFRETIGIPAVSQVGAPLAAILQSARTMQQIMNANVLERRLRINLKCLHQHTAIAALAHGT